MAWLHTTLSGTPTACCTHVPATASETALAQVYVLISQGVDSPCVNSYREASRLDAMHLTDVEVQRHNSEEEGQQEGQEFVPRSINGGWLFMNLAGT